MCKKGVRIELEDSGAGEKSKGKPSVSRFALASPSHEIEREPSFVLTDLEI